LSTTVPASLGDQSPEQPYRHEGKASRFWNSLPGNGVGLGILSITPDTAGSVVKGVEEILHPQAIKP
jgi:hypothetical protein